VDPFWLAVWYVRGEREGDLTGTDDVAVKMLSREGSSVDVLGSKFYDFR
jgi:hypothetical protein